MRSERDISTQSMSEVHRTVNVDHPNWMRRLFAFVGPAYMVSVGYMDPGNWATDIEGGARFGYALIWVLLMSNMMAVLLQTLAARLGLATGKDLAQACRDGYPGPVRIVLYVLCEIAIIAMDLAELLGTAIGLNLLLGIPMMPAVLLTGFDVLVLLGLQRLGIRKMEAFIVALVSTIGLCFIIQIFLAGPDWEGIAGGFVPGKLDHTALYIAIGIIGATVMPHNLYLHSSLVQSRNVGRTKGDIARACYFNFIDSAVALNAAFFVNAAILIVAAAVFYRHGVVVTEIQQAHQLLNDLLGSKLAPIAFAVALICAGQSSTLTGTMAGQICMEGFLHFRMRPWLRRMITRGLAIIPAVVAIWLLGDASTYRLLILSQVVLSLQLPFAVVPLVRFTSDKEKMGPFASAVWVKVLAWLISITIIALNAMLVYQEIGAWYEGAGSLGWVVLITAVPAAGSLGALLVWMIFRSQHNGVEVDESEVGAVVESAMSEAASYGRIGVAIEASKNDRAMVKQAVAIAKAHRARLVLIHVVEGAGGQWYGEMTDDAESRGDEAYMSRLVSQLRKRLVDAGVPEVKGVLGYGSVVGEIVRIAKDEKLDLLILGGHGHRGITDVIHGQTIPGVRHGLDIPILAVRNDLE